MIRKNRPRSLSTVGLLKPENIAKNSKMVNNFLFRIFFCENLFVLAYDVTKINAFCIDWDKLATADNYFIAAFNSFLVGRYAGQKLGGDLFLKHFQQTPDQIHIIGNYFLPINYVLISQIIKLLQDTV